MNIALPRETLQDFLRRMLLIRRAEEQIVRFATVHEGLMRGVYHVYIGQEATAVGVCAHLRPDDYVFTTHRNHGHVLAKGGEPGPLLAEVLGRVTGYNQGRGGSMHVIMPQLGILHTSAIVGGCLPLAIGAAFSIQRRGTDQVSVAFFGDGVLEEGAFYEAINLAALWKLPVVFLCENNAVPPERRAGGPHPSASHAATQLVDVPRAFNIPAAVVDGADVQAVYRLTRDVIEGTRHGTGPFFVEARSQHWPAEQGWVPEHPVRDFDITWAWEIPDVPPALQDWLRRSDPICLFVRNLVQEGVLSRQQAEDIDRAVREEVAQAAHFALTSPPPAPERALEHIFA